MGAQMDGPGGIPVFGLGDPRNTPSDPPTQNGHPGVEAGIGLESPGRGAPGIPSLVFLERLNGKRLADGRSPMRLQGSQRC